MPVPDSWRGWEDVCRGWSGFAGRQGPSNNGGFAPDVLRAAAFIVGTSACFGEALGRSLAFAGLANYCPVLVGAVGGARWGASTVPPSSLAHVAILPRARGAPPPWLPAGRKAPDDEPMRALVVALVTTLHEREADRHLLRLVRDGKDKSKFLCGHDERHWFVAGIPESAPVGTVRQAKEALKPAEALSAQAGKRLRAKARKRRKNAAFVRQGEWFFLPCPASPWTRSWSWPTSR